MFDWLWRKPSERPVAEVPEMPLAYKFEPQADITAYEIALLMTEFGVAADTASFPAVERSASSSLTK
jgi:hypothetical protein